MDTGTARKFFTLYYIPLIPYKNLGEVTKCRQCKNVYETVRSTRTSHGMTQSSSTRDRQQMSTSGIQELKSRYESGTADFQAGRHAEAIIHLRALLRLTNIPDEILAVAYQLLSRSYVEQKDYDSAMHYSDKLFAMRGKPPSFEDHSLRIQICMMAGDNDKVMRAVELAKTRYGDRFDVKEVEGGTIISNSPIDPSLFGEEALPAALPPKTKKSVENRIYCPSCNTDYPAGTIHRHCLQCNTRLPSRSEVVPSRRDVEVEDDDDDDDW